jgi:hypothetical protein
MRHIHDHKLNGLNEAIEIKAGEPRSCGASREYEFSLVAPGRIPTSLPTIFFQDGPIQSPTDYNGLTNEAVLAVVIDRMRGFQSGPFACRENAIALTKMEEALMWLQKRTRDRLARGVEGTLQK